MKRPTHQSLKQEAFKKPGIKKEYDALEEKFSLMTELMTSRQGEPPPMPKRQFI